MLEAPDPGKGMLLIVSAVMIGSLLAAMAIIHAAGGLEKMSYLILHTTEKNVGSKLNIFSIVGGGGYDDAKVEELNIFVNLGSGGDYLNWSSTRITIDGENHYQSLEYAGPGIKTPINSKEYGIQYLYRKAVDGNPEYIYLGDRASINIQLDPPIGQNEKLFIQIIPVYGNIARVTIETPLSMTSHRTTFYP